MTRPVRVLQVIGSLGMGGAETWLMEVLRLWKRTGEGEMDFLLTSGHRDHFDEEAEALGARLYYFPFRRQNLPGFIGAFRGLLGKGRYDAIHDHADYAGGWRFLFGLGRLPRNRIAHVHNPIIHIEVNYAVSNLRRASARLGKALVESMATNICGTSQDALIRYGFDPAICRKAAVLHCGFDVSRFDRPRDEDRTSVRAEFGWTPDTRIALFAGRLDRALENFHPQNHKNSWFALNVAKMAIERDSRVRLLVAGQGPTQDTIRAALMNWGLADRIILAGVRHDLPRLMRAADILLFPSAQEGLGMVAVEAQAAGLPVLASTAVPSEAIVIPTMVDRLSVRAPMEHWCEALLARFGAPKPDDNSCRATVEASDFSIVRSADRLLKLYSAERR